MYICALNQLSWHLIFAFSSRQIIIKLTFSIFENFCVVCIHVHNSLNVHFLTFATSRFLHYSYSCVKYAIFKRIIFKLYDMTLYRYVYDTAFFMNDIMLFNYHFLRKWKMQWWIMMVQTFFKFQCIHKMKRLHDHQCYDSQ